MLVPIDLRGRMKCGIARCLPGWAPMLLGVLLTFPCDAAIEFLGDVDQVTVSPDAVNMTFASGPVARVEFLDASLLRVRVSPAGSFSSRETGAVSASGLTPPGALIEDLPDAVLLASPELWVVIFKAPFRVVILRPDGTTVLSDAELAVGFDSETGLILSRKQAPPDEGYFGFGFRGGPLDRRGRYITMYNIDEIAYGEFTDPLYLSIPFYYGLRDGSAYGVFLDNAAVPFFDLDSSGSGHVVFGALAGELDYYVMAGPEPAEVLRTYTRLTGTTPLPPKWTLGYHQSRFGYQSQQEFLDLANEFRTRQIPADVLYFDLDYLHLLQLFTWNPVTFPSPEEMNAQLEADGFKRVNIIDPVVHPGDALWPFLDSARFFLTDVDTGESIVNTIFLGDVSWLDFTKDATKDWYAETLTTFLSTGITAVWNDLNEPAQAFMPNAIYDFNGDPRPDIEARNLYALEETEVSYQAQLAARPDVRPWVLSRSGFSGIQRYAANWSGDTLTSFDSLRVSIQVSTSMGLSGQNFFGHDIGGFLGSPSGELFVRWLQFGSFTPLFRNHAVHTSAPREPWVFGDPYTEIIKTVVEERYRLLPYTYSLFESAAHDGTAVLAPTLYYFPDDPLTTGQDTEFMWGPSLLVAPVHEAGATTRDLHLPAGANWYDYHTDTFYMGGQSITVDAPLERMPLFVRAGAIIPHGPIMQYVTDPVSPLVDTDLYPGPDGSFDLYEDDGESFAYQQGMFLRTRLTQTQQPGLRRLTIERLEGDWTPPQRPWWLRFHRVATVPAEVSLNGVPLQRVATEAALGGVVQGWYYNPGDELVVVKVPDSAAPLGIDLTG